MKRTRIESKSRTPAQVPTGCSSSLYPKLDALFDQLARNEHPNVIDLMAAISDLVAFSTECDMNPTAPVAEPQFMSQKKCRFCD